MTPEPEPRQSCHRHRWVIVGSLDAVLLLSLVHLSSGWVLIMVVGSTLALSLAVGRWSRSWAT